jgi:hypothetical protein
VNPESSIAAAHDMKVPGRRTFLAVWVRRWPWVTSLIAALAVDLIIGAIRHFDFNGINGFSTLNYGWLAFSFVGGVVFAWRIAGAPARGWAVLRVLIAPITAFVLCYLLVTVTGAIFLPDQPIMVTLVTDAPGRAIWLAIYVAVGTIAAELTRLAFRAFRRIRTTKVTTARHQ